VLGCEVVFASLKLKGLKIGRGRGAFLVYIDRGRVVRPCCLVKICYARALGGIVCFIYMAGWAGLVGLGWDGMDGIGVF
jgi:hypothetical protein